MNNTVEITHSGVDVEREHHPKQQTDKNILEVHPFKIEVDSSPHEIEYSAVSIREQLHTLNRIKSERTEHMKIYERILKILDLCGTVIGYRVTYNWKIYRDIAFSISTFALLVAGYALLYTPYLHYKNGNYIRILEPFAMLGYTISMYMKLIRHVMRYKQTFSLIFSTRTLCRQNLTSHRADILKQDCLHTLRIVKVYFVVTAFALSCFCIPGVYMYFAKNVRMNLLPVSYNFFDESTFIGFIETNSLHSVLGVFGTAATTFHGAVFIIIISNYILRVDLIQQDVKDLDEMWNNKNEISIAYKRAYLLNICKKKQDMTKYMNVTNEIFQTKLTAYFFFNYFSLVVCLFEIKKFDYIPGFGMAMSTFMEMTFYCLMGSRITTANEKFAKFIYATNWYQYDLQSKKMILILLHDCQQAKEIQLGPLGPLNIMTGVKITKSIYSYYTVLMEVF